MLLPAGQPTAPLPESPSRLAALACVDARPLVGFAAQGEEGEDGGDLEQDRGGFGGSN